MDDNQKVEGTEPTTGVAPTEPVAENPEAPVTESAEVPATETETPVEETEDKAEEPVA